MRRNEKGVEVEKDRKTDRDRERERGERMWNAFYSFSSAIYMTVMILAFNISLIQHSSAFYFFIYIPQHRRGSSMPNDFYLYWKICMMCSGVTYYTSLCKLSLLSSFRMDEDLNVFLNPPMKRGVYLASD